MTDKNCLQHVLGGLIKKPSLLSEVDKYSLDITDFSRNFERAIFVAITGLYLNGAKTIGIIDIENYLEADDVSKAVFKQNNGIEYLQDIIEFSEPDNFDYYYGKLKKLNLIRDLKKLGIDTSSFYSEDLTSSKAFEINQNFEKLDVRDIIDSVKRKLLGLEKEYLRNDVTETESAYKGIEDLIASFGEQQDIGLPIQGQIFNEIVIGARKGKLYIRSGSSGVSKTRQAVGDACYLAFPMRYSSEKDQWVRTGNSKRVLFIATEQSIDEIRSMILAYLTGIDESKFRFGQFSKKETLIMKQAVEVFKEFEDNFSIVRMPNPTIELVKSIVRENCLIKEIEYVFYDYIFIGPSLLNEFKGFGLRNDEVLLMFATALKDLAVELNVFVMTSTQLNAKGDDNKDIKNEGTLAGGRSTINKADVGAIMSRPTKEELDILSPLVSKYGAPNLVTDIFKIRAGAWNQVRIWSKINLGIIRKEDLFITNSQLEAISDFFVHEMYTIEEWENDEEMQIARKVKEINEMEVK